ncbi:hypothetical protein DEW08_10125 [Azospirillum thermophilum]|uniref:Uncharacterized protein n=2 Tax=Azospirillum thermophilum TaxID=2202148 RepID=A0A2S2CQ17_9PROT|nr:hypothetical protein DEW08_10125 [Azospirillum thermophilum]
MTVAGSIEKDGAYVHPAAEQFMPDFRKMLEQAKAELRGEMKKEFGEVVALKADYDILQKNQEEQVRS